MDYLGRLPKQEREEETRERKRASHLDTVLLHGQEEAARELRAAGAGVEQSWRRMSEPALGHEVVGLEREHRTQN